MPTQFCGNPEKWTTNERPSKLTLTNHQRSQRAFLPFTFYTCCALRCGTATRSQARCAKDWAFADYHLEQEQHLAADKKYRLEFERGWGVSA